MENIRKNHSGSLKNGLNNQFEDRQILDLLRKEAEREEQTISLIASENYAPQAVLDSLSSVLTNKYAEGYPGKRYYGGCQVIDQVELIAQERCKRLFGAEHVNVQPHAGSQANMAVYFAALNPGDTILGMSLQEGGHLTHGYKINFSGKLFKSVSYTLDKQTERLDFAQIRSLAHEHKPKMIIAGASAYSRSIDFAQFAQIAQEVGAYFMADIAHIAGLVATGLHESPVPHADFITSTTHKTLRGPRGGLIMSKALHGASIDRATMPGMQGGPLMHVIAAKAIAFELALQPAFKDYQTQVLKNARILAQAFHDLGYRIVSGGTDNHLFVIDLRNQNITGKEAEQTLEKINVIANRNCIPFDPQSPLITSGLRIGTPALTTRGMGQEQMYQIAHFIHEALQNKTSDIYLAKIRNEIKQLCNSFPIY